MHGTAIPAPSRPRSALDLFGDTRGVLIAIWAIYLTLRVAVLFVGVHPTSDADWYFGQAAGLAAGRGYLGSDGMPTAFWPVGWPLVLSLVFHVTGPSLVALGLFNLAASALSGWLTLKIGRRLFESEAAARMGLLLLAVYPNAIGYVPLALTEVFYTALLLLGAWLLIERRSAIWLVAAGLVFGLATLVKAQTLVVVPLIFAIEWLREGDVWRRLPGLVAQGLLVLGVAALAVFPWTVRNHEQLGHWVAVSTNGGFTLLTGNNDEATGDYTPDARVVKDLMARPGLDEVSRDAEAKRLGMAWIEEHPGGFLKLMPKKFMRLWLPDGEAEWAYQGGHPYYADQAFWFRAVRYANQAYYFALLAAFAAAFVVMTRRRLKSGSRWVGHWLLPYGIAAYPTAICLVFSGQSRFHYPAMPFVCMSAGWLIVVVLQMVPDRSRGATAPLPA